MNTENRKAEREISTTKARNCQKCGNSMDVTAKFCPECGTRGEPRQKVKNRRKKIGLKEGALIVLAILIYVWAASSLGRETSKSGVTPLDLLAFVFILVLYLFPTFIASARKVRNLGSIFVINLFLGWTFIGWVVALAMSFSDSRQQATNSEKQSS